MKRSLFVVFCLATMVYAGAAYAAETIKDCMEDITCLAGETYTLVGQSATGCNMYYEKCYKCPDNLKFYDCTTCKSGYTHSTETLQVSTYTSVTVGQCKSTSSGGTYCSITNYTGSNYPTISNCASIKAQKFGTTIVSTCEKCNTGYNLVSQQISVDGCSNKYTQSTCRKKMELDCDPLQCVSDLRWSSPSAGANYVTKMNRSCDALKGCVSAPVYSCASGYYGTADALSQNCYACPKGGTSAPGDNTEITKCYSTGGKDAAGDYSFSPKCYYAEQ